MEFEKSKIIYPNICQRPEFTFDNNRLYTNQKCFIIPGDDKYLLGILNSRLSFFLFKQILPKLRGDFFEPGYKYMKDFPISRLDPENKEEKAMYDQMEIMVNEMLELNRKLDETGDKRDKEQLDETIRRLDQRIDQLVYRLYGLNDEEIAIVEGNVEKST